jgi:hypothetical protein
MKRQRGTTLIELMVALTVGMLVAVGVFSIMALAEGRRRATTTVNTLNADGLVASGHIERWLRSVGSGLSPGAGYVYGCVLTASKGGIAILPLSKALPAPFDGFDNTTPVRVAPVIIWPAGDKATRDSDMLMLMSSGSGGGALPVAFDVAPDTKTLYLKHHARDFARPQRLHRRCGGPEPGQPAAHRQLCRQRYPRRQAPFHAGRRGGQQHLVHL